MAAAAAVGLFIALASASFGFAQIDTCGSELSGFLPSPFNASALSCRPIWNSFILRYSQDEDNVLNIILSAEYTSGWVGMGFSNDGMMIGSSAMVGWIGKGGRAHIKQFYLRGQSSSEVIVNEGMSTPAAFSYPYTLKRNHGALAIFGWGVFLPFGAIVARYCKQWDPTWYYLHVSLQFAGFIIGLAGLVAGIRLYDTLHSDVFTHRGLGIFVFVLGILQVIAFFIHPDRESKIRKYWNWYHHWEGRLALFLAAVNIVLGIHVGRAGLLWKLGYGFNLALIFVTIVALEILSWARCSVKSVASPAF